MRSPSGGRSGWPNTRVGTLKFRVSRSSGGGSGKGTEGPPPPFPLSLANRQHQVDLSAMFSWSNLVFVECEDDIILYTVYSIISELAGWLGYT